ncbi:MAG: hypothetical protein WC911_01620 [Thermoleophilia bacterium]
MKGALIPFLLLCIILQLLCMVLAIGDVAAHLDRIATTIETCKDAE